MSQLIKNLLCVLLLAAGVARANAFSLGGPLDTTWQVQTIGYGLDTAGGTIDFVGPMNLGEEYRWNSPMIVYAFAPSFLDYFGQDGVDAVEAAIKILNDLPAFSKMSRELTEFPLDTRRFNFQATALGIRDMKSWTLSLLLEALGVGTAERWVYTLRARVAPPPLELYSVFKRNFDPVTYEPSSYVNGTLYTYTISQTYATPPFDAWEAVEVTVDPLAPSITSVTGLMAATLGGTPDLRGAGVLINPGLFYTGLTRDDVGALRYLYRSSNFNVENVATNAVSPTTSSGGGGLPWMPAPGSTAGGTGTGTGAGAGTGTGAGGVPGGGVTTTNALVDVAVRPGADKLKFLRANFDSTLGVFFTNSVTFTDTFITNGATRQQLVQRVLTTPDILFSAADLGVGVNGVTPITLSRSVSFQNNSALNTVDPNAGTAAGPGVISSSVITFSKVGPFFVNNGQTSESDAARGLVWGSFNGSTNAPILFPRGLSLQVLERLVSERNGGTPWRIQGVQ